MISTRRSFLQIASLAAVSSVARTGWSTPSSTPIGAQLFTLRKEVKTDLPGTLAALKKIGFQMVETFIPMYDRPAKELRRMIEDAGLTVPSGHFAYSTLETDIEYAHELGVKHMVCAMLPDAMWNREGFTQVAAEFNKAGAKAKTMNINFCFHNHNFEFRPLTPGDPSDTGLNILLKNTDHELVSWEEDCYWVTQGGNNAAEMLHKHQDRIVMLHLKDRRPDVPVTYIQGKESEFFTEIGTGTIDWAKIVKFAQSTGKLMFIEQDSTTMPPIDSLASSYRNLQKYLA